MFVTEESALLNRLSLQLAALHCPSLYTPSQSTTGSTSLSFTTPSQSTIGSTSLSFTTPSQSTTGSTSLSFTTLSQSTTGSTSLSFTIHHLSPQLAALHCPSLHYLSPQLAALHCPSLYTISVYNWQYFIVLHYMGTVSSCIFIIWQLVSRHAHAFSSTTSTCLYSCSHTTSSTTSATNASISCQCSHASNLPIFLCSIVLDRTKSFSWEFKRMRGPVLSDLCQRQHFKMYWLQDA